ncbi:MAG: hypothetical protein QOD32_480 [Pyrinomonadaceae bacterium]|nr:hypothetical protein [Pyrinomonadaceae bacterium]
MTDEEKRLLRLEKAYATLAELAANQDERAFSLRQLLAKQDERMTGLEDSFKMLVELARNASERADQHESWINDLGAAQANSETKIAALADAQIRTDESLIMLREAQANSDIKIAALADAQIRTDESLVRLAEAQAHTEQRLDALIDIVGKSRNGNNP